MAENSSKVILNGVLLPEEEACISATSRGLMYGDGCFETFRSYNGHFLKLEAHLNRLEEGLDFLAIGYPENLKCEKLKTLLISLLTANNLLEKEAIIRLQVWRKGDRGYSIQTDEAGYSITAAPFMAKKKELRLATVDIKRISSKTLPSRYKLSNGLNYIIAAKQAAQRNADDALLETIDGYISETTIANIFWKKGNTVFTPSVDCDILPGVTRSIIIKLLKYELKTEVKEGAFSVESIKDADTVWICNSLKEIQLVKRIDDIEFDTTVPFIQKLKEVFWDYRNEQLAK